jgi:hypothetical protein
MWRSKKKRIARQEVLIERLRKAGASPDEALKLLGSMQSLLEVMRSHLARLSN